MSVVFVCLHVCMHTMCLNFKAKGVLLQTARVWGTTNTLLIQNAKRDTCTHQWKSLKSAHRLAYLPSQVLLYSRRVSRNVKALIFFCQAMSKDKNMANVELLGTQPSKKWQQTNKHTNKKKRIEL